MARSGATSSLRSEFDAFLLAPIGDDHNNNGMQLSVLSALARQNVDPWEEAARLACLSSETATRKLASLIAALPDGPSTGLDSGTIAARLTALLPREAGIRSRTTLSDVETMITSWPVKHIIIYVIVTIFMLLARWLTANHLATAQADKASTPIYSHVVSQTPPPNSGQ